MRRNEAASSQKTRKIATRRTAVDDKSGSTDMERRFFATTSGFWRIKRLRKAKPMNVGDFSAIFAAQTAAVKSRRLNPERFEADAATRRAEQRASDAAKPRSLSSIAESRKIVGDKERIASNDRRERLVRADLSRRSDERSAGPTAPDDELGARLDVFC